MELSNKNFWELSPYCYCRDREWLTIDDTSVISIPLGGEDQEEMVAISGLSRDDTALLAGLMSALALLLFLIFLLLCCLFPWGLCCAGGDGVCCGGGGGKGRKRKEGLISSSASSTGSVNLTALDMKIPRPWTDGLDSYSDGDYEKTRKMYAETNLDKTDQRGFTNEAYQKDASSSFFQDGGWFTTSDLESVYGNGSTGRGSGRRRRRSFDDTGSAHGSVSRKRNQQTMTSMSRSMDDLDRDTLMTYSRNQIYGHQQQQQQQQQQHEASSSALAYARSQTRDQAANVNNGHHNDDSNNLVDNYYYHHGDGVTSFSAGYHDNGGMVAAGVGAGTGDGGSIVEELKLTRTKTLNLPGAGQSGGQSERPGQFPSVTSPMPYMETANQIVSSTDADNRTRMNRVPHTQERIPDGDGVSEYRAYKRILRETTTTTTTTTED